MLQKWYESKVSMTQELPYLDQKLTCNSFQLQVFSPKGYIHEEDAQQTEHFCSLNMTVLCSPHGDAKNCCMGTCVHN